MAKLLSTIGALSGSVAGNTYSHNKGGAYIRARKVPTNPTSGKQMATRSRLALASSQWAGLTGAQKASWVTYAATHLYIDSLGSSITLSGQQMYIALAAVALAMGNTPSTTAPATGDPAAPTGVVVTLTSPQSISVAFTNTLAAGQRLAVWQCVPGSAGRDPNARQARLQLFSSAAATTPVTGTSQFAAAGGDVSNFYVAVCSSYGQQSPRVKASATAS